MAGLWLIAACGEAEVVDTSQASVGGAAGTAPGGGTGGSSDFDAGGGGIGLIGSGGSIKDATAEPVVVQDAGWFDCGNCLCDGGSAYCLHASGGAPLYPATPPDAAVCPQDGGELGCKPLPSACNGVPSCSCVDIPGPHCVCEDAGGGILVSCSVP